MTRHRNTGTLTVTAAQRARVNAALERHGYGPDNFSIPLVNGSRQIIEYAASWAMDDVALAIVQDVLGVDGEYHRDKDVDTVAAEKDLTRVRRRTPRSSRL